MDSTLKLTGNDRIDIGRILIIGLGLIGGSLAAALRSRNVCRAVVGASRRPETVEKALAMGIIDEGVTDLAEAVPSADIIVLCAPLGGYKGLFQAIKPYLRADTILTDVGSVKEPVIDTAIEVFGSVPPMLVPGHPIAGSERSGVSASNGELFKDHIVLLTPLGSTNRSALKTIESMWQCVDANVKSLDPLHHDAVLAATSHLPHLLAFSLVDTLAGEPKNREIFEYAAGGFRDFSRIAASDPTMWHDIFQSNTKAVLDVLDRFSEGVALLREAIATQDSETMLGIFTRAKAAREHFSVVLENRTYSGKRGAEKVDNSMGSMQYLAKPGGTLKGDIRVPGDKSISHRAVMLGSLANGVTEVTGWLEGEDALATLQAFRDMGVVIEGPVEGCLTVHGVGLHGLKPAPGPLYLGNSGTSMRLLAGLLSGQSFSVKLTGDSSLSKRPMGRVANPLKLMGATIKTEDGGTPPVIIEPVVDTLKAIQYDMPIASAQVKSSILLAGLYAEGETFVEEPAPTRDHTERMLKGFGVNVSRTEKPNGVAKIGIKGGQTLTATNIDVPADISSAAFFLVAASIAPSSELLLQHVGINPTRIGVINILRLMGANIELQNSREIGGEPVADLLVKSAKLRGIEIPVDQVPLAIDEFPVLFVAAACAQGVTTLSGAEELRVKESDRIQAMADGLAILGISVEPTAHGIIIHGKGDQDGAPVFSGGEVESCDDHRIAMSFAVASLRAESPIKVNECNNVATSFPSFIELANKVGFDIEVNE